MQCMAKVSEMYVRHRGTAHMWDLEYCDSELRAVEASGESRDELCPSTDTAETQSQVDGW